MPPPHQLPETRTGRRHGIGGGGAVAVVVVVVALVALAVAALLAQRHALELVEEPAPVVRQHFGVLDPLARPVLVPPANVVLRGLEGDELVAEALLDKDATIVLLDDRLFVL